MLDAVVMGSAFVEFVPTRMRVDVSRVGLFRLSIGGSATNISVALSRLGAKVGLITAVGGDDMGSYVLDVLKSNQVDISRVKKVRGSRTGLSFYTVDTRGKKTYHFYRFPGFSTPEATLSPRDLDRNYLSGARGLALGEAFVRRRPSRDLALAAIKVAKNRGIPVLYDPNFRLSLWNSRDEAAKVTERFVSLASIVTPNQKEALLITGRKNVASAIEDLTQLCNGIVAVKLAERGCTIATRQEITHIPAFKVRAIDDTGAGDAFAAGLLTGILNGLKARDAATLANAVAALKVSMLGTVEAMPTLREVKRFLRSKKTAVPGL